MPEELQGLLDRIHKEGLEKAEAESEKLLAEARQAAERITAEAQKQAQDILKKADEDSGALADRGRKALDQAARDVLLSLEERIGAALRELVNREISDALTPPVLAEMIVTAVKNYCEHEGASGRLDVLLSPEQQMAVREHFISKLSGALREGVEIKGDEGVISGFTISVVDDKVHHDFSGSALTEAVCALVRPHLAEIVRTAGK